MEIELILPGEMTLADLADRLADAAWGLLEADERERPRYQGRFGQITEAILDRLTAMKVREQAEGGIRSVHLACEESASRDVLETGLTDAIAGRVKSLLSDLRAVRLITHDLPEVLGDVLRPYEWVDRGQSVNQSARAA